MLLEVQQGRHVGVLHGAEPIWHILLFRFGKTATLCRHRVTPQNRTCMAADSNLVLRDLGAVLRVGRNVNSITSQDATHNLLHCLALPPKISINAIFKADQEFVVGQACQVVVLVARLFEVHKRHLGLDVGTEDWKGIPLCSRVLLVLAHVRVPAGESARRLRLCDTLPVKSSSINILGCC